MIRGFSMNVLSLFGGPRKKGNTATVLGWVENELQALGHQTERIFLGSKTVNGCLGCMTCKDNADEPGCIQKDDGAEIIRKITASDAVLFVSPLYFWGFSAQMKALVDRCFCLHRGVCGSSGHTSFVEGQRQALIVTAADPFENNAEQLLTSFQRMLVYSKASCAGEFLVHNCKEPDQLGSDIKKDATRFARQMFNDREAPYAILIPGGAPHWVPKAD
ncbi:MAG: flavodoxin family protein [Desulfobacteraceae bacterium]|nr:MAG: flavodoxin family protein [Desulfobacteraceae bacterium]